MTKYIIGDFDRGYTWTPSDDVVRRLRSRGVVFLSDDGSKIVEVTE